MKNLKMLPVFVVKKTLILRCVMHFQQVDPWFFFPMRELLIHYHVQVQ